MLVFIAVLSLAYWLMLATAVILTVRGVPELGASPARGDRPRVSLIIPARDEADHIAAALRSKLADSYPALEIVFVDDRSTDGTGAIADELAREDDRLKVVHVTKLSDGWLGKVHAMQHGLERATGDWVLFSDADVAFAPGTLDRVMAEATERAVDHVTLLPRIDGRGPLLEAALAAFFRVVIAGGRLFAIARTESSAAGGVGAFNLVRKEALARTPGLAWLKMEIADDMALGVMLKRAGLRSCVLNGSDCVSLQFYPSYRALVRAVEKNGAAAPFPVLVLVNLLLVLLEGGFLLGPAPLAALAFSVATCSSLVLARWLRLPLWPSLLPVAGMGLLAAAMIRAGALAAARGGVFWRGTFYPTPRLKEGRRIGVIPSAASGEGDS